jgi:glyoxylase-like metal-dependent hydrolase (beta-lactamase superfamily II)
LSIEVHSVVTGPFQENSHLVIDSKSRKGVCIDPGDEAPLIINMITTNECTPLAIVNTHAHFDHIGAITALQREYSIPFYLHKNEEMILDTYIETSRFFNLPVDKTPIVDHWIEDEATLEFGNLSFKLLFTPGHTPGGTSFMIEDHVFVGDTLFRGSVGRTDLPGGNWQILELSLIKLMENIDHNFVIHSGHGPTTTMASEIKENPFLISLINRVN